MSTIITFAMLCLTAVVDDIFFLLCSQPESFILLFVLAQANGILVHLRKGYIDLGTGLTEEQKKRNRYSISSAFHIDISEKNMDEG